MLGSYMLIWVIFRDAMDSLFEVNVLWKNEIYVMLQEDKLIDAVQEVLQGSKKTVFMEMSIGNEQRSFGTTTSYHISRYMSKIYPLS